jgi:hypothetical protein
MRSLALLLVLTAACGGDPTNFTGMYSLSLTNGENGCDFANWEVGASSTGVPIVVTQVEGDADVSIQVQGVAGLLISLLTTEDTTTDSVDGDNLEATIVGTRSTTEGNCTYTVTVTISATLDNDTVTGTIRYSTPTNDAPDCGAREQCRSVQNFNGTRPPSGPQ